MNIDYFYSPNEQMLEIGECRFMIVDADEEGGRWEWVMLNEKDDEIVSIAGFSTPDEAKANATSFAEVLKAELSSRESEWRDYQSNGYDNSDVGEPYRDFEDMDDYFSGDVSGTTAALDTHFRRKRA